MLLKIHDHQIVYGLFIAHYKSVQRPFMHQKNYALIMVDVFMSKIRKIRSKSWSCIWLISYLWFAAVAVKAHMSHESLDVLRRQKG